MIDEKYSIHYGSKVIEFKLVRRVRKTLSINVYPDLRVEVIAPNDVSIESIYDKVRLRSRWITTQLRKFRGFFPKSLERQYLPGETHLYLGRQYRLKVVEKPKVGVSLVRGFIMLETPAPKEPHVTRELVETWFLKQAKVKFHERLEHCVRLFPHPEQVRPTGVSVRQLAARWGSMTSAGRLVLNRRLIQAPVCCIDYVIVHELCHRIHAHHGVEFWQLLDRILPNWGKLKHQLEQIMA